MKTAGIVLWLCVAAWGKRPVTLPEIEALRDIGEAQVSPGDTVVVFTMTARDVARNRTTTRLMRMPARGGEPVEVAGAPEGAGSLRWSPDGRRVAFLAGDAVWRLDAATWKCARVCGYSRSNAFLTKAGNW